MIINTFKGRTCAPYVALDTETRTYVDGVLHTDAELRAMAGETHVVKGKRVPVRSVAWWREHAEVRCWAYLIYAPDGFAICETFDEFAETLCDIRARYAWWYYAPFDMAVLDSDMLRRGYTYHADKIPPRAPKTYADLSSDFGMRYSVDINLPYIRRKGDRSKRETWRVTMYDLSNILAGGLEKLLASFDVRDADGAPIRKLKMDYQTATGSEDDVAYMRNDVAGLWWLVDKASAFLEENYGFGIRHGKPDVLTASGLAKKVLLRRMYPNASNDSKRLRLLRKAMPMWIELDEYVRERGLLGGGRVMVNPDFKGKHLKGITAYRYDVNSEYPWYMEQMQSIASPPDTFPSVESAREMLGDDACIMYEIAELHAIVKPHMIPAWRNPFTTNIESEYFIHQGDDPIMLFKEEYDELSTYWYDVDHVKISKVIACKTFKNEALSALMRDEYKRKADAKVEKDDVKAYFSKLIMNGLGGKFSQNPRHVRKTRKLGDSGIVNRETVTKRTRQGDAPVVDTDERALMNVIQGARITCGGRCLLMRLAREICGGNVRSHLYYTDTDSLHVNVKAPAHLVDAYRLGALKCENDNPITEACFLAPKTYYERERGGKLELHAKGVHTEDLQNLVKRGVPLETIYKAGYRVQSLSALNVRGGKALLALPKVMLKDKPENFINEME